MEQQMVPSCWDEQVTCLFVQSTAVVCPIVQVQRCRVV